MKRISLLIALCLCAMAQTLQASIIEQYRFEGSLGDKIPVTITFCVNSEMIVAGDIYYKNSGSPSPIMIVGFKDGSTYNLSEYKNDGTITGYLEFRIKKVAGKTMLEGKWTNPKTWKEFRMKNMVCTGTSTNATKYLEPEDPQQIGRKYSFQQWDDGYQCMMGGVMTLKGAGKHKVHFDISNVRHNMAEVTSAPNRPAELSSYPYNYFYYYNANECGYAFVTYFFKRFAVIKSVSDYDTFDCFGMGATLDGVYIKVVQ